MECTHPELTENDIYKVIQADISVHIVNYVYFNFSSFEVAILVRYCTLGSKDF